MSYYYLTDDGAKIDPPKPPAAKVDPLPSPAPPSNPDTTPSDTPFLSNTLKIALATSGVLLLVVLLMLFILYIVSDKTA